MPPRSLAVEFKREPTVGRVKVPRLPLFKIHASRTGSMMPSRWNYLVSETQFATELVVTGIRKLCIVPIRADAWPVGYDQTYPLYVGLHSYTTGLERLCKLTIACHGFAAAGSFPPLRPFGHKIVELLDAVERLDFSSVPQLHKTPAARPSDDLDPALTVALERFANGAGRYEHLDSLWNAQADVATLNTWGHLCRHVTLSERLKFVLSLRETTISAIRTLCTNGELEASAYTLLETMDPYLSESSTALALRLYKKASWVASTLDALTYYTREDLPLLGEAVRDILPAAEEFLQYSIAQIEDEEVTLRELQQHFEQFPEQDDDDLTE